MQQETAAVCRYVMVATERSGLYMYWTTVIVSLYQRVFARLHRNSEPINKMV
uniref:Uncharacterized protein n=2 Tax=Anguilla anguilla TaxID=7936 RepID=A0A0E9PMC4_ANGAN